MPSRPISAPSFTSTLPLWAALSALLGIVAAASWADAESERPPLSPVERLQMFRQNQKLIESLVDNGVKLAAVDDPLKRASACNDVAKDFVEEMEGAIDDGDRLTELAGHLRTLLERGLAANLNRASGTIPVGSAREQQLYDVHRETTRVLKPLETRLDKAIPPRRPVKGRSQTSDSEAALHDVQLGRGQVDDVLKSRKK